jgi:hypothetical protein
MLPETYIKAADVLSSAVADLVETHEVDPADVIVCMSRISLSLVRDHYPCPSAAAKLTDLITHMEIEEVAKS